MALGILLLAVTLSTGSSLPNPPVQVMHGVTVNASGVLQGADTNLFSRNLPALSNAYSAVLSAQLGGALTNNDSRLITLKSNLVVNGKGIFTGGTAAGLNSFSVNGTASGNNSVAFHQGVTLGDDSFAAPWGHAGGLSSFAGPSSVAYGTLSAAFGGGHALADNSFVAAGGSVESTGTNSITFGYASSTSGTNSSTFGVWANNRNNNTFLIHGQTLVFDAGASGDGTGLTNSGTMSANTNAFASLKDAATIAAARGGGASSVIITPSMKYTFTGGTLASASPSSGLRAGLFAYWAMEESAPPYLDSTTGGHTLWDRYGNTGVGGGIIGNAANVGWGGYLDLLDKPYPQGSWSLSLWFTMNNGANPVFTWNDGSGNTMFQFGFDGPPNNNVNFNNVIIANTDFSSSVSSTIADCGYWHHLVLVYNQPNGTADLYLDGAALFSGQSAGYSFYLSMFNTMDFQTANIDEVGLWNRPLTSAEVTALYNSGAGLPVTSF